MEDLPSVIPVQRWIPVSDSLPEEEEKVLVQCDDLYYNMNENTGIILGWRVGKYWFTYTANGLERIRYVISWMPLPERYKVESEDDNAESNN